MAPAGDRGDNSEGSGWRGGAWAKGLKGAAGGVPMVCIGGANGLACGASVAGGDVMVAPQFGHGPDTPAISAGTVSKMPQVWQ